MSLTLMSLVAIRATVKKGSKMVCPCSSAVFERSPQTHCFCSLGCSWIKYEKGGWANEDGAKCLNLNSRGVTCEHSAVGPLTSPRHSDNQALSTVHRSLISPGNCCLFYINTTQQCHTASKQTHMYLLCHIIVQTPIQAQLKTCH